MKRFLKSFHLIFYNKNDTKFHISPPPPQLWSKNYEIASKESHSLRTFQQYEKFTSIYLKYLSFDFLIFSLTICSILNNSCNRNQNITKSLIENLFIGGFPTIPRVQWEEPWFWRFHFEKQTQQTNKKHLCR